MEEKKIKARGLGRGLDALFGDEEAGEKPAQKTIAREAGEPIAQATPSIGRKVISVAQIIPSPTQPRRHFDDMALQDLARSIEEHGLIQPIMVRPSPQDKTMFEIVAGERRWRACQLAKLHEVPVIIRDLNDEETFQIALVENLQREDLNPIEEARGYQRLAEEFGHSHEEIGRVLGKSRSYIANMVRLLGLSNDVQTMLEVGDISIGHARALLSVDKPTAFQIGLRIIQEKLSVRDVEKLVARGKGAVRKNKKSASNSTFPDRPTNKDADHLAMEKNLSDHLGMNTLFEMKDHQSGIVVIQFRTLEQFDLILNLLSQDAKR